MRSALAKVPQIKNLECSPDSDGGKASFSVPKGFDYAAALDAAVAAGNEHVKGWSKAE